MNSFFVLILLAVVEGLTEFLPVSSTGHMILVEHFLGEHGLRPAFLGEYMVIIQLGAILAVVLYFWQDLTPFVKTKREFTAKFQLWMKILVGVLPAAVLGLLFDDYISEHLMDNVPVVIFTLIFYGILLIAIEKYHKKKQSQAKYEYFARLPYKMAFLIGFFQCLAMIPGTSRSGATILGALLLGLSRPLATEFSFYLAIPTMAGATLLKLIKSGFAYSPVEWSLLAIGSIIAFLVAYLVIHWFMNYIKRKDFIFFGGYRIILGLIVLIIYCF